MSELAGGARLGWGRRFAVALSVRSVARAGASPWAKAQHTALTCIGWRRYEGGKVCNTRSAFGCVSACIGVGVCMCVIAWMYSYDSTFNGTHTPVMRSPPG